MSIKIKHGFNIKHQELCLFYNSIKEVKLKWKALHY